jgi:hypothetical protein
MAGKKVTSLCHYKAEQEYRRFMSLPSTMRTLERAETVLAAIFNYAYEHIDTKNGNPVRNVSWEDTRRVSVKLVEFMPASDVSDPDTTMQWLHENMVPEAWMSPDYLKDFIHECLRHG